jgi:hypothetical protein
MLNTSELGFDSVKLQGFDGIRDGELVVKFMKMHDGSSGFNLSFQREGKKAEFCVSGINAKMLAAYIALWA